MNANAKPWENLEIIKEIMFKINLMKTRNKINAIKLLLFPLNNLFFLDKTISKDCVRIVPGVYNKILHLQWSWIGGTLRLSLILQLNFKFGLLWLCQKMNIC